MTEWLANNNMLIKNMLVAYLLNEKKRADLFVSRLPRSDQ